MNSYNNKKNNTALLAAICTGFVATTSLKTALSIGLAASIVLIITNLIMHLFINKAPNSMLMLFYIILTAFITSIMYLIFQAYFPDIVNELGIYIPVLLFTISIIVQIFLHEKKYSILNILALSIGFILILCGIGIIRELLGGKYTAILEAPAAFIITGFLLAILSGIFDKDKKTA
ncbi:MAG TPA: hypothetical protein GX392_09260 [Clostridiales bacterium]|nr:hypothetical protein [Clostridiales bacterium]